MKKLFEDNKIICGNKCIVCHKCNKITKTNEKHKLRICVIGKDGIEKIEIFYYCKKCAENIKLGARNENK